MTNYEKILKSVEEGNTIHLMMLNSTKKEILGSSVEKLAEIINTRMDKNPCNYYCDNCGNKGVPISVCDENIIRYLNS